MAAVTICSDFGAPQNKVELFQTLKDDAVKVLHSVWQKIWKTQQWPQDWKRSVFIPIPKKVNAKKCSNYHAMALISHARKVMLKILHERWTSICASLIKKRQRNQRLNSKHLSDHQKSKSSRKTSISALLTMPKPLTMWITINCGKFWKRWAYQTTWPASWETCMQVRKQQLELDMNNRLVPNRKRSTSRVYIVTLLI